MIVLKHDLAARERELSATSTLINSLYSVVLSQLKRPCSRFQLQALLFGTDGDFYRDLQFILLNKNLIIYINTAVIVKSVDMCFEVYMPNSNEIRL